eukprot:364615-Chlamydomonas_euryale.AAC.48
MSRWHLVPVVAAAAPKAQSVPAPAHWLQPCVEFKRSRWCYTSSLLVRWVKGQIDNCPFGTCLIYTAAVLRLTCATPPGW